MILTLFRNAFQKKQDPKKKNGIILQPDKGFIRSALPLIKAVLSRPEYRIQDVNAVNDQCRRKKQANGQPFIELFFFGPGSAKSLQGKNILFFLQVPHILPAQVEKIGGESPRPALLQDLLRFFFHSFRRFLRSNRQSEQGLRRILMQLGQFRRQRLVIRPKHRFGIRRHFGQPFSVYVFVSYSIDRNRRSRTIRISLCGFQAGQFLNQFDSQIRVGRLLGYGPYRSVVA